MRWNTPASAASRDTPPNPAPNSTKVPVIPTADAAQHAAQRKSRRRPAEPAQTNASIGMPTKMGIAQRLCSFPARVGALGRDPPSEPCSDGGNPPTGSVTNTPEPINPTPAARVIAGTTDGLTTSAWLCARPPAATQYSAPTTTKLARCAQPSRPAPSELTAWRRQSYPARLAPIRVKAPMNTGAAKTPHAVLARTAVCLPSATRRPMVIGILSCETRAGEGRRPASRPGPGSTTSVLCP